MKRTGKGVVDQFKGDNAITVGDMMHMLQCMLDDNKCTKMTPLAQVCGPDSIAPITTASPGNVNKVLQTTAALWVYQMDPEKRNNLDSSVVLLH